MVFPTIDQIKLKVYAMLLFFDVRNQYHNLLLYMYLTRGRTMIDCNDRLASFILANKEQRLKHVDLLIALYRYTYSRLFENRTGNDLLDVNFLTFAESYLTGWGKIQKKLADCSYAFSIDSHYITGRSLHSAFRIPANQLIMRNENVVPYRSTLHHHIIFWSTNYAAKDESGTVDYSLP